MAITRPPFTGVHEVLPNSGGNVPHEGGGTLPPFGEDPFNRIVDINFGAVRVGGTGAVWVSGDSCCYLRTGVAPTLSVEDQVWHGLTSLMFGAGGTNTSSAYGNIHGRPTFLMGGHGLAAGYNGDVFGGIIALSHDGRTWDTTYFSSTNNWHISDLTWNVEEQMFYARGTISGSLRSPDGYSWTHLPDDDYWRHVFPADGWSDGLRGYNPFTGQIIYPDDVAVWTPDFPFYCYCTAFCGNMWMAGGYHYADPFYGSMTMCSVDDGQTWAIATYGRIGNAADYPISCISGGPIQDFS